MNRTLISALFFVLANAVGLLVAALLLDGFNLNIMGFIVGTLLLSVVEAGAGPLIAQVSPKNLPRLQGGIALITTFVGLWITGLIVGGMTITGLTPLLAATLLVWLGSLFASIILPEVMFKSQNSAGKN